ncbi:hypothetical protein BHE74_00006804 [Ensete ventricosum]|nr:hypothetical protein GW17_00014163 [Ensete ventricosum]RWW84580.1 hypothetical protein BHE74_00006804 [Ensete ventricosum]
MVNYDYEHKHRFEIAKFSQPQYGAVAFRGYLEVPKELISQAVLEELRVQRRPSFVSMSKEGNATKLFDKETGIIQCRLSNGIPVNYKVLMFSNDCCVHHLSI